MREQYDHRSSLRSLVAFPCPSPHRFAVRRIAKHAMATPVLLESVILLGEVGDAFCIGGRSAWVKGEIELRVELIEEGRGVGQSSVRLE
jgi:hypothetical protein